MYFLFLLCILSILCQSSFAADSTTVKTVPTTVTQAPPSTYILGTGTILGTVSKSGWFDITYANPKIYDGSFKLDYTPTNSAGVSDVCAAGFYPVISYGIIKANTKDDNSSYGTRTEICFRPPTTGGGYEAYINDMRNKRSDGADRYVYINYTVSCIRCASSSCPQMIAPIPRDSDANQIYCPNY